MRVLGLDTSTTSTGYAIIDNGKLIDYGCIKPPNKLNTIDRIIYIEKEVKEIIFKKEIEYVVIEELAIMRNGSTAKILAGLLYHLMIEFRKRELLTVLVRPSEARKGRITGKNRQELKQNAIYYVKSKYKIKDVNDDIADSIILAEYGSELEIE